MGDDDEAGGGIETRLRAALRDALKTRDLVAAFALRSALGAIGNAEAVPATPDVPAPGSGAASGLVRTDSPYVAQAAAGAGAAEVSRRPLSQADVSGIVRAEISERETTAGQYELAGHADRAARLRREAQILRQVLGGPVDRTAPPEG